MVRGTGVRWGFMAGAEFAAAAWGSKGLVVVSVYVTEVAQSCGYPRFCARGGTLSG